MSKCTKVCGKKKKRNEKRRSRDSRQLAITEDKSVEAKNTSGEYEPSDFDSIITDTGDYRTLPDKSTPSNRSKLRRKRQISDRAKVSEDHKDENKKGHYDSYSERSCISMTRGLSRRRKTRPTVSNNDYSSETTRASGKSAMVKVRRYMNTETSESSSFNDTDDGRGCEDEECGRDARVRVSMGNSPPESSESSTEEFSYSDESEKCPELCETDPSKLPEEKPKKCDSSCRKQQWLQRQRQRKQDEMDDYLLRKGFRYFDDMCKCSLKCLMSQIYVDPFVRNITISTIGFCLGVKLCWELDGFYVLF